MAYVDHAVRLWPYLIARAPKRSTVTYERVATFLGHRNPRIVGRGLHPIVEICSDEGWPIITALVINAQTRRPGRGLDAWITDFDAELDRIAVFPWERVTPSLPLPEVVELSTDGGFRVEDSLLLTKGRGPFQARFRRLLLQNYRSQCALCDTRLPRLLVASHILPWSIDPDQRLNPSNGILLCKTHDALFELGVIRILPDLSVMVIVPKRPSMGVDLASFISCTRSRLRRPVQALPDPRFLERRLIAVAAATEHA